MTPDEASTELQAEINRFAQHFNIRPLPFGLRTNDGLNVYVDTDGTYHYAFYEQRKLSTHNAGSLDDVLYWYSEDVVSSQTRYVNSRQTFLRVFELLTHHDPEWGKRYVRDLAKLFRNGQPQDIALLPDIGEPL